MYYLLALFIAATIYFQARVTGCVLRAPEYDASQKQLQFALIWLLPLFGAWLAYAMMASTRERVVRAEPVVMEVKDDKPDVLDLFDPR